MKKLLDYIDEKNQEFGRCKIFGWLSDERIKPEERLNFAPYMAHFVFSFMDINRFVLRDINGSDELQQLVNIHTNEDSHHWPWYLADLKRMNLDKQQSFTETLYFLWGDHGIKSRMITYEMAAIARRLNSKEKIVLVEVIEKTGNIFLGCTAKTCVEAGIADNLLYYGSNHLASETGHTMGTEDIESKLHQIKLSEEEETSGYRLIDNIFKLYHDFVDEMYEFAVNNSFEDLLATKSYQSRINRNDVVGNGPKPRALTQVSV